MALVNVKYSDITTPVLNYILSNCKNIDSRYDNDVPMCFKSGYVLVVNQPHNCWTGGKHYRGCQYVPKVRYKITGKTVIKYTTAQVTNNFNTFVATLTSNVNRVIPNNEFFDFIIAMVNYISSHMVYFSSHMLNSTTPILVFAVNAPVENPIDDPYPPLIKADTTKELLKSLTKMFTSKIYNVICQYNVTYVSERNW